MNHLASGGGESGVETEDKETCEEVKVEIPDDHLTKTQAPQTDKCTDTTSSHKLNALKEAKINSGIENTKKRFSDTFNKTELCFFEKLFRIANIAQDGLLSESELRFFLDQHDYIISKQEARQVIKEADTNKDNALDFEEFLSLCIKAKLNLQQIGILSQDGEEQLQNSVKIRKIFRLIFESIGIVPSIQETVEYFENKIAEGVNSLMTLQPTTRPQKPAWAKALTRLSGDLSTTYDENDDDDVQHHSGYYPQQNSVVSITDSEYDFDLIVIGSGAGGNSVAKEASKLGKKVAICDSTNSPLPIRSLNMAFGPSCMTVSCVPKMLMNYAGLVGEAVHKMTSMPFGWFAPDEKEQIEKEGENSRQRSVFTNDWATLVDNIQAHISMLNYEKQFALQNYKGIHYFNSNCEFDEPHKIKLVHEDKSIEFITGEKIVIAVGSTYSHLDVPGAPGNCITVDDIFSQRQHPGRCLIVGGGPDAIECAGLLCGLNIEVTIMSRSPALKGFDRRMVTLILETLHSRGVKIMIGWTPIDILAGDNTHLNKKVLPRKTLSVTSKHLQTGERTCKVFDTIILATEKKPSSIFLKLEKADILTDETTHKIWVDSQDMTTTEDIFALGDCASKRPSDTPVAYLAGVNLSKRLYQGSESTMEYDQVTPKFLLTPVQYSSVGLSEEASIHEYGEAAIEIYHSRFQPLQYQLGKRHKDVYYAKMLTLKTESERIIGMHYLGPNAGEIMQGFVLALKLKATKADIDSIIAIHPTCAEIFTRMTKDSEESSTDSFLASCSC